MQIYVTVPGDTVNAIARKFGVAESEIVYDNQIPYPYRLTVGQALLIREAEEWSEGIQGESGQPQGAGIPVISENRAATVNGYAYPFISPYVLDQTLPFLTSLSVFSYGFTVQGDLIPPLLPDDWMIQKALETNTAPILTLTPFGPDGQFNNNLISVVVNDMEAQNRLIENLTETVLQKGFRGVDIDFEFILAKDRLAFVEFVRNVRAAMQQYGYPVSVALAPKISDTQSGLLYEGKDYALLGEAADSVLLMTYEWGYTYGPPMAVAPLNKVIEVVEYALTRIAPEKIDLGIPNYGYDWTLPFQKGVSAARTIGNVEAVQLAVEKGASIQFDENAKSPWFGYVQDGISHEVWFEDVRSLNEKFSLVGRYNLRGMGYWTVMQLFRANWLLLEGRFGIKKGI